MKIKDRSQTNIQTGDTFGQPRLNDGYIPPKTGLTPEPVTTASDDLDAKEGHVPCEGGESSKSGPQAVEKAQGPVVARPDAAPVGVKAAIGGRDQLARGPAVANPDTSGFTVSSR
jgi:hypothetical protein